MVTESPKKESEPQDFRYKQVVFGHPVEQFDRDQLCAWYIAIKLGTLSFTAPATFISPVPADALHNKETLVIEGVPREGYDVNRVKLGNFDNGPNDTPAAAMFAHALSREVGASSWGSKIKDLVHWLTSVEKHQPMKQELKSLHKGDIDTLTAIFYALKKDFANRPSELLKACYTLMENLFNTDPQRKALEKIYQEPLARLQIERIPHFDALKERAQNPRYLRTTTALSGLKLAYFDIQGLESEEGAFAVASQDTGADIILLVDEHKDTHGQKTGTQLKIKVSKKNEPEKIDELDLTAILSQRLNTSEALFGKGYEFVTTNPAGGHPGIIGSPRGQGSDLEPKRVWAAISDFFDAPRYSAEAWQHKALEIAHKVETIQVYPALEIIPSDAYHLSKRAFTLVLPHQGGVSKSITITEDDLPYYDDVFGENVAENQQILLAKTEIKDSDAIKQCRYAKAMTFLDSRLKDNDCEGVLKAINYLDTNAIGRLPSEQLLRILELLGRDEQAIDTVWNGDNLRFGITYKPIPDWIKAHPEQYKAARYRYDSVPKKVEASIIGTLKMQVRSADTAIQSRFADALMRIITHDRYKTTHQEKAYDELLESALSFASDRRVDSVVGADIKNILMTQYGREQVAHWQSVAEREALILGQLVQESEDFRLFLEDVGIEFQTKNIPDLPASLIVEPEIRRLEANVQRQREQGLAPYVTVVVQIGDTTVEHALTTVGVTRIETDAEGNYVYEPEVSTDAAIHIPGLLRLDRSHQDQRKVARELASLVKRVAALSPPEATIRIVRGRFPGIVAADAAVALVTDPAIDDALKKRIVWCDFNQQDQRYYDSPLL